MKTFYKILGLTVIDFALIWLWVYMVDPDPSTSILMLIFVPFVLVLNLIIAGVLFYLKKKELSKVFLINSIIASVLIYYLFGKGIDRYQNKRVESWTFHKEDTSFYVIRWKETNTFSINYSLNPGSSWGYIHGSYTKENEQWLLNSDSLRMLITPDDKLIGFRNMKDTFQMFKNKR